MTEQYIVFDITYYHEQSKPDSKVDGANMGQIWVLSAQDGPHVGPINFSIREGRPVQFITRPTYGDTRLTTLHTRHK